MTVLHYQQHLTAFIDGYNSNRSRVRHVFTRNRVSPKVDNVTLYVPDAPLARAANRSIEQAKTQMSREIRSEYRLDANTVRERLRIRRATARDGQFLVEASLSANGKRSLNLIRFVERSATLAEGRRRGKAGTAGQVFVQIKRTGGKQALGPRAFIANHGRTVFQRQGKKRLPIKALSTIDVPQMFNAKRINRAVVESLVRNFPARFEREVRFALRKFAGK